MVVSCGRRDEWERSRAVAFRWSAAGAKPAEVTAHALADADRCAHQRRRDRVQAVADQDGP